MTKAKTTDTPSGAELDRQFSDVMKNPGIRCGAPEHIVRQYVARCASLGVDPYGGQLRIADRRYTDKSGRQKGGFRIESTIDGLRAVAQRSGQYAGQSGPWWCGEDEVWHETWPHKTTPVAAKVIVKKVVGGVASETPAVAHFDEYLPKGLAPMWRKMPRTMIAKCSEALALRKAFPELSGLYTSEEMDQAVSDGDAAQAEATPAKVASAEPGNQEQERWELIASALRERIDRADSFDVLKGILEEAFEASLCGDLSGDYYEGLKERANERWQRVKSNSTGVDPAALAGRSSEAPTSRSKSA